jgi:holo-[acyl-carrier protein] synthase
MGVRLPRVASRPTPRLRVGIDVVRVSRIAQSIDTFGERFLRRVFTPAEVAYAQSAPAAAAERLAARFAAKEAAIKALALASAGVGWTDLEVHRHPDGACDLVLHGSARAAARALGCAHLAVSLSHEDDYATAVVLAELEWRGRGRTRLGR